jgi:hypothetical protein
MAGVLANQGIDFNLLICDRDGTGRKINLYRPMRGELAHMYLCTD